MPLAAASFQHVRVHLHVELSPDALEARRSEWHAPAPKFTKGWLARYAALVTSANTGAVLGVPGVAAAVYTAAKPLNGTKKSTAPLGAAREEARQVAELAAGG
jgi:hypothetical protein